MLSLSAIEISMFVPAEVDGVEDVVGGGVVGAGVVTT
jgi:hypothetical protein